MNKKNDFCPYCKSKNTHVAQIRKNKAAPKPIYRCRDCERRFTIDDGYKKLRHPKIVIRAAMNLSKKGASLREVVEYLRENFRVNVTRKAVYDWKKRFEEYS